ncbi:MAG: aldehyde ferredoxin oxidoreductase C-terminal domain-containing protein [Rhodospirillales bacterium]
MRRRLTIDLTTRAVREETLTGADIARAGRWLIARTLLDMGAAKADPLGPENPLIFSAGPFAGTNFSNANRLSVGCKSPLTGGVKEANTGGTFGFALGQLEIAGFTLTGASDDWVVIRLPKEGGVVFEPADDLLGLSTSETQKKLVERYGDKTASALIGPAGEYGGLIAGISFTDVEGRPARLAARGGVGAVMGAKKVKAIVADKVKMPAFHDRRRLMVAVKEYGKQLNEQPPVQNMQKYGTALMGDFINKIGALPVRNFSDGQLIDTSDGTLFALGGQHIQERNSGRGGDTTHACMPGCMIKCSNIYVDTQGEEITSPLEYETLGLLGSNCGLTDPDDVARLNGVCNDLGVDTIETGAMLAVLMDAGEAEFGDVEFMAAQLREIAKGTARGRMLAQGAGHVGRKLGLKRVPVIKNQAVSAYDPRVIEVTGITMMYTAQGADHTAGNLPQYECDGKTTEQLTRESHAMQMWCAAADSLGLCIFGRSVHNEQPQMIVDAVNAAFDAGLEPGFLQKLGNDCLRLEKEFNTAAGFTLADDELPEFFRDEPLAPQNKTARHQPDEINRVMNEILASA